MIDMHTLDAKVMKSLPGSAEIALQVASGRELDYLTITYGQSAPMRYPPWLHLDAGAEPGDYLWPVLGQRVCIECTSPMISDDIVPLIETLNRDGCSTIVVLYYRAMDALIIDGTRVRKKPTGKAIALLWSRRVRHYKRCGQPLDYDEVFALGHDGLAALAQTTARAA